MDAGAPDGTPAASSFQQQQQTGVLLNMRQQVQPAFIIAVMHAQHASIIAQQDGSPLVQVTHTPSSVGSHLHMAMTRLQQHTVMPFTMQQQLHRLPGIMVQRFWSMVAETLSSHAQTIFIPPAHFLNVIVQRGTIKTFMPVGAAAGAPRSPLGFDTGMPGIPTPARSIKTAELILLSFGDHPLSRSTRNSPGPKVDRRLVKNQVVLQEFEGM
jgi:hypothetical protein